MLNKYKEPLFIFSFILVLFLFLFGSGLGAGYILDDHSVIQNREELRSASALYKVFLLPWHQDQPWAGNYRPLTLLSYALTLSFSESTTLLRLINIILHSANATLIFYLVNSYFSRKSAYLTAVGFTILPINIGNVMSLVGRSDLLSAFFILISLILFYKERHIFGAASFSLALLAKEFSIFLLLIIMIISIISEKYNLKKVFIKLSPYLVSLIPYLLLRYLALGEYAFNSKGSVDPIIGPLAFASLKERILTGFVYFYFYLRKTFLPVDLSTDYSFNQISVPDILNPNLIMGLMALLVILLIFFKSRDQRIKISIIFFLVPFGVISNTIFITTGTFAERWWYFSSMGLVLFVSILIARLLESRKSFYKFLIYPFILAAGVFYLYISLEQAKIWTNERRLFITAALRSPNSAWARTNLAAVYFKEKEFDQAKNEIEYSLKISENYPFTLNIHAKLKWREGEFSEAETAFIKALKNDIHKRNHRDLYRSLAVLKLETGDYNESLTYIKNVLESIAFGDAEKAVYLDNLLLNHIKNLAENKPSSLSDSEKKVVETLIAHVKGF